MDRVALGKVFLSALHFLLPFIIPQMFRAHLSSKADKIDAFEATIPRDFVLIPRYK
jgi:hypothetical protein